MYIYGFTSLSSTVHLVAARPRTAGFVAGTVVAALLMWHHVSKPVQTPAEHPATQTVALVQR